jgi:transposase
VISMLYTGLDIHKKTIYGTIVDERGKIVQQENFYNTEEHLKAFLAGRPMKIVIEACSLWMNIHDILSKDYEVILAHPTKIKAIASAKMKTDKIDSEMLAHLLRCDLIPEAYAAPKEVREQRELIRFRSNLVRTRSRFKNKIKAILLRRGFVYKKQIWTKKWRDQIVQVDSQIGSYYRIMDQLNVEIKEANKKVEGINQDDKQADLLKTIYGISDYSARVILAEIGDVKRFPSAKQLKSYVGICPGIHQSGGTLRNTPITKQGSKWVRWILVQCVWSCLKNKENKLSKFHARLCRRKKKQVATIATAAKMLEIIYAMLRDNKPYVS